jgi:hypothetical protein
MTYVLMYIACQVSGVNVKLNLNIGCKLKYHV